jgi:hypothetical protein
MKEDRLDQSMPGGILEQRNTQAFRTNLKETRGTVENKDRGSWEV